MAYRRAHGNGADALARIETVPADELPDGVPGPARPAANRDEAGKVVPGPGTSALAAAGGRAKAMSQKLARLLGFAKLDKDHPFRPYARLAVEWRDDQATELAATFGGGQLSPGVNSIVASAALSLAASRYLHDQAAEKSDAKLFAQSARLADQSRQAILTAHELAAREARARTTPTGAPLPKVRTL